MANNKEKIIVMFSGGLDSRLVVKILQEKGFEVIALFFKFPFGTGCCDENCSFNFSQLSGIKLNVIDCTKGQFLNEYIEVIKHPKYNRGASMNPCIDCRIFMFKKAREFADLNGIKLIATGEVEGERPLSQTQKAMALIEEESGLKGRILRPLIELGIKGRCRKKQMEMAEKYKISYPTPAGGCLLCEKNIKNRIKEIIKRKINEQQIELIGIGRHFLIDDCWIVLGRNEKENKIIENIKEYDVIMSSFPGPSAIVFGGCNKDLKQKVYKENGKFSSKLFAKGIKQKVYELIMAYSTGRNLEKRKEFEGYKL
ncbi:MAG: 7-cyano-7-deazaguanine synthase [Nanoarchaeota archaeon]|nr:7-cyano-7-deazaguanine synthase [Nanoarchaeota archaeon]